ncbi:amidohydrolase-domain-containing protein [Cytidiella melzeri]|nr:amidohydrolase-domain-containing protein [Cytidiella melzeri]
MNTPSLDNLATVTRSFPAIDNHAHPLLKREFRNKFAFEGLISEATDEALTVDAVHTLSCFRATLQLSKLLKIEDEPSWDAVKKARGEMDYELLCRSNMEQAHIQCILLDDGLGGVSEFAENHLWHNKFTSSSNKRILRVEVLAESILKRLFSENGHIGHGDDAFRNELYDALRNAATDPDVAGFKSIACYRTGLNVGTNIMWLDVAEAYRMLHSAYKATGAGDLRLETKLINDFVVNASLQVAGECGKPVQFHTGLGDSDITLALSSPSHMQPLIKAYPNTKIVLLHSSYPYTRDAGYLTAVYPNVFLDFGEIFPFVSAEGQLAVVRQMLELCPTNKILWSTDGHWWPESYYLGAIQAREALLKVLGETVLRQEMTEAQAITVVKNALFYNANRIYNLGLEPRWSLPSTI